MNNFWWAWAATAITVVVLFVKFVRWTASVDSDRKEFRDFMTEVREDIKEVREDIKKILLRTKPMPTSTSSPIRLTDLGEKISVHTGAKEWAESQAGNLFEKTNGMNAFEIQTASFDYANSFAPDEDLLQKMQESAFDSGIDLDGIRDVFGVELRDCLLNMHNVKHSSLNE